MLGSAADKPGDVAVLAHLRVTCVATGRHLVQFLFTLVFLPYDACISLDAIARTAARLLWTKRRLLEWKTSSEAQRSARTDLGGFLRKAQAEKTPMNRRDGFKPTTISERFGDEDSLYHRATKSSQSYGPLNN